MSVKLIGRRLNNYRTNLKSGASAFVLSVVIGGLCIQPAQAQSANGKADSNAFERDVIIVTANKREENVQDVPIAITVFSEDDLEKSGIVDMNGMSQLTPSFTANRKDAASSQFSIRGIGSTDDGAAADNSVIVYIDEVPIGRAAGMDMDLFDLERVEILRGPQGTLFGRNVVGGAIVLVTSKPDEETRIKFEAKVGNLDRQDFRGLLSGQISEKVFGKISFSSRNRKGYLDSTIDQIPNSAALFPNLSQSLQKSVRALDIDTSTIRTGLRFVPSSALEINVSGSYSTLDQAGPQRVFIGDGQQFGVGGNALLPGFRNDFTKEFFEDPGFAKIDTWSGAVHTDYTLGNDYLLTSISSIRRLESAVNDVISTEAQTRAILATGATNAVLIAPASNDFSENSTTFTQELRITSPDQVRLKWMAGAFYLHEDVRRNETVNLGLLIRDANNVVSVLAPPAESGDDQDVAVNSYAVFGQASYELVDNLEFTAGVRYTYDTKSISRVGTADGIVVAVPFFVQNRATFNKVTPKFVVSYKPDDDVMLYTSFSRGFKSGGFQGRGTTALAVGTPFNPETADSYEAGIKATLFGGRLVINPAAFHTDFSDLQVVELLRPAGSPPGTTSSLITQNAANASIDGFELQYSLTPIDGLSLNGSFSVTDAHFTQFFAPAGFESESGAALTDRVGNKLARTPKFALSQRVRYTWPAPSLNGTLAVGADYTHKSKMFGDVANNPDVVTPAYDLVNLSLTYHRDGEHGTDLTFWVDNAFDENYLLNNFAQDGGGRGLPAAPRTYGLTLRWTY
ncbi:MAG: hypothetical protein COA84_08465 [Robiginitomaculum sp.]|nr:MAG: hypothetical protein COA84_08465 [Robiginitomaculum sp.]